MYQLSKLWLAEVDSGSHPEMVEEYQNIRNEWYGLGHTTYEQTYTEATAFRSPYRILWKILHQINLLMFPTDKYHIYDALIGADDLYRMKDAIHCTDDAMYGIYILRASRSTISRHLELTNITELEALAASIKNKTDDYVKVFTVPKNNILYVITDTAISIKNLYKLQAIYWNLHKNDVEFPVPELINFYEASYNENLEEANKALKDIQTKESMIDRKYARLKDVFCSRKTQRLRSLETNNDDLMRNIEDYKRRINEYIERFKDNMEQITYLKFKEDDTDTNALFKYFAKHPYIKRVTKYNDNTVQFYYEAPLLYYSPSVAKKVMTHYNGDNKKIIQAIISQRFELYTRCVLFFNTYNFDLTADRTDNDNHFICHPHIARYRCLGNHTQDVTDAAISGDFFGGIEQITQAVLNLNFYDSIVISEMLKNIERNKYIKTWFDKETNEFIDTNTLLVRMEEQNGTTETNTESEG